MAAAVAAAAGPITKRLKPKRTLLPTHSLSNHRVSRQTSTRRSKGPFRTIFSVLADQLHRSDDNLSLSCLRHAK